MINLLDSSVNEMKNYLKKNYYNLSKEERLDIENMILAERVENGLFAEQIVNSKLYKLAQAQLLRESKGTRLKVGGEVFYDYDPVELLFTISRIVHKAESKKIKI